MKLPNLLTGCCLKLSWHSNKLQFLKKMYQGMSFKTKSEKLTFSPRCIDITHSHNKLMIQTMSMLHGIAATQDVMKNLLYLVHVVPFHTLDRSCLLSSFSPIFQVVCSLILVYEVQSSVMAYEEQVSQYHGVLSDF